MPQSLAAISDRLFVERLLSHGPDTRSNVASAVAISLPTASESARRLQEAGLVCMVPRPADQPPARRGRAPDYYDIDPSYGHSVTLAAAAGRIRVRAQNLRGEPIVERGAELPESMTASEFEGVLHDLVAEVSAATGSRCLAATMSQGNPVDPATQRPVVLPDAPFPEGLGDPLGALRTICDGPVLLDNDVNWAVWAEHQLGTARGLDDVVLLYLGPGVGAGVVMNGRVHRGHHGTAGELGYLRSGKRTLTSLLLEQGGATSGGDRLDVAGILDLFATEPSAQRAEDFVTLLVEAVGNIVTFVDPQAVVLSGPLAGSEPFIGLLREHLPPQVLGGVIDMPVSELGEDAPLLGAGLAARDLAQQRIWENYRS